MIRPSHIIILVVVLILVFGARKLPEIAKSIGQSLKVFKKEVGELRDDPPAPTPVPAPTPPPAATEGGGGADQPREDPPAA